MSATEAELAGLRDTLLAWLFEEALPLWWRVGGDHAGGGFFEAIGQDGKPVLGDRRARVQARQIFTYAVAGEMGWSGPWREAMRHGLDYFVTRYRRPDRLFWNAVTADGTPTGAEPYLYEQAFALLAFATAHAMAPDPALPAMAEAIRERLTQDRRNPAGGFTGFVKPDVFQSDPHMHLFEAALAWDQAAPDARWRTLADEIAELAMARMISPACGAVMEYFQSDWSPQPGRDGHLLWPGHQFEWAGLLQRWSQARGRGDVRPTVRRLFDIGANHGIDAERAVALFELLDDFSVSDAKARLWSQTEWPKAAILLARGEADCERREALLDNAACGAKALLTFLDVPVKGAWRDKLLADGTWVEEPSPASSFYHIIDFLRVLAQGWAAV